MPKLWALHTPPVLRFEGPPEIKQHEANCSMTRHTQTEELRWSGHLQGLARLVQGFPRSTPTTTRVSRKRLIQAHAPLANLDKLDGSIEGQRSGNSWHEVGRTSTYACKVRNSGLERRRTRKKKRERSGNCCHFFLSSQMAAWLPRPTPPQRQVGRGTALSCT